MAITERTLKKWRKEALDLNHRMSHIGLDGLDENQIVKFFNELIDRNLRMTQELTDLALLRK